MVASGAENGLDEPCQYFCFLVLSREYEPIRICKTMNDIHIVITRSLVESPYDICP